MNRLFEQSLARIRELAGVESAAVGLSVPYERPLNFGFRRIDGPHTDRSGAITNLTYVTPEYFRVLRIPLLQGRVFTEADGPRSTKVVVVNEAFVQKYLSDQYAIGSHLRIEGHEPSEIMGVVGDVQQRPGWGDFGPLAPMPGVFMPAAQTSDKFLQLVHTWFSPTWVVRTSGPRDGVIAARQPPSQPETHLVNAWPGRSGSAGDRQGIAEVVEVSVGHEHEVAPIDGTRRLGAIGVGKPRIDEDRLAARSLDLVARMPVPREGRVTIETHAHLPRHRSRRA